MMIILSDWCRIQGGSNVRVAVVLSALYLSVNLICDNAISHYHSIMIVK